LGYVDDVIKYMTDQKASAFIIPAGKNMVLQIGDQAFPQSQSLTTDQLVSLIRQTAPATLGGAARRGET